ncbi:MAG TPA: DALR domain-containing protein, partial [Candidatus Eisenbacteria bacterium]|nr:DALR domain-containing protein [Candidatus Eisenbacteria bacterium]
HYRETFNFTIEGLDEARSALGRLDECLAKLHELAAGQTAAPEPSLVQHFTEAMDEDLNVSAGWAVLFDWVRDTNRALATSQLSSSQAAAALAAWQKIDSVFGIGHKAHPDEAPPEIVQLLEDRQAARKAKDFKRADALRDELKAKGWVIEDTPKGPRLKRL